MRVGREMVDESLTTRCGEVGGGQVGRFRREVIGGIPQYHGFGMGKAGGCVERVSIFLNSF